MKVLSRGSIVLLVLSFCLCSTTLMAGDYLVGPGDVLSISVYDNEDLTTKVRVSSSGTIVMPLLGQVEVQGATVNAITDKITRLLANGYLVNPQVNIFVEEYRSKKVVVLGNVRTPGLIELSGPTNFLELVSKAGGLEKDAGDTATIQRKGGQEVEPCQNEVHIHQIGEDKLNCRKAIRCHPQQYPGD